MTEDSKSYAAIPSGREHLRLIRIGAKNVQNTSAQAPDDHDNEFEFIGTALSVLFQAATCHRGCNQGRHLFEAICARTYNLGASALLLTESGFYDEAGNLIRSIGEIGNLISLSVFDKPQFRRWIESDDNTRKREFSPVKIRKIIEEKRGVLIADSNWYGRFCQAYTHVTPKTVPGMYNPSGQGNAGGVYQSEGLSKTLEELANVLVPSAMFVCMYFKFDDLFQEIESLIKAVTPAQQSSGSS